MVLLKLGKPKPLSNFASEENSIVPLTMEVKTPSSLVFHATPLEKAMPLFFLVFARIDEA